MLKRFTAQNFDNELYTALDFTESDAFLYISKDGDISTLKRFIQLLWASTIEDGIGLQFSFNSSDHNLTSTEDNIYLDEKAVRINDMENFYNIKFSDYSKNFIITYTQLLNLELSRTSPRRYLNRYALHKSDSKSYYSPIEDVFYDIEQSKKYSNKEENESSEEEKVDLNERIEELQNKISNLESSEDTNENYKDNSSRIKELETEIGNQKLQDQLLSEKENLNREIDILNKKVRQYEEALEKVSKVDIDLNKHNSFMNLNPERVEKDLSLFTYRVREREKTLSDLSHQPHRYTEDNKTIAFLPIIVLLTVALAFGVTLSFLTSILHGTVLSFIFCSFIILYFIFAHKEQSNISEEVMTKTKLETMAHELETLKTAKLKYLNNLGFNSEDDYFATKALVRVLLYQKENELTALHERFDGKELSDYRVDLENAKNQLLKVQMEIDNYGPVLSPEDYIRKRRELDILKLESSESKSPKSNNKEEELSNLKKELAQLMSAKQNDKSPIDRYIEIIRNYYKNDEISATSDYILDGIETHTYDEKVEMMIVQRIAYINSQYGNSDLPVIFEDPFAGVEDNNLIKKILEFCVEYFQIILISEHESYKDLGLKIINE